MSDWQGEIREGTPKNIREFWAGKAEGFKDAHGGMMRDHYYRLAEIDALSREISGDRVLDAGCGAGWATMFYAVKASSIVGCDITEGLIARANRMLSDGNFRSRNYWEGLAPLGAPPYIHNVTFEAQDVLDLPYPDGEFDVVMWQRLLINLPTWELQQRALESLLRVLAPRGQVLMSEVTEDGHARVNALREMFGLGPLVRYWHNRYLRQEEILPKLNESGLRGRSACLGLHGFLSKVFYPAMAAPEDPQFMSPFNKAVYMVGLAGPPRVDLVHFLDEVFREALAYQLGPHYVWADAYDGVLERVEGLGLGMEDIRECNHQTLYIMRRLGGQQ